MGIAPTIAAASIGIPDTLFLMLLALVVFGPRRLPEIGRQIGKLMYEFRKVSNDFKYQMEEELRASEEADRQKKLQATVEAAPISQATLDVPPQPIAPESPLELAAPEPTPAPAVEGEIRESAPSVPAIQPPSTGEAVSAQRPFRGRPAEPIIAESTLDSQEASSESLSAQPVPISPKAESPASAPQEASHV